MGGMLAFMCWVMVVKNAIIAAWNAGSIADGWEGFMIGAASCNEVK